ncbi:MAG: T9SS type A sorting domain-containing protein [Saprospiraceae bacterium]|nr:T9SS type A sorting domain-containing protein [Saprospiraceae bacterium]
MHQIAEHPEMLEKMQNIERQTAQFAAEGRVEMRGGQMTIPVVVHIVYRTDVENISVEQIQSQIDALNRDYNKQNSDITKVPAEFSGRTADCQIRFQLASRDPQGKATSGIVRYATTKTKWGATDDIKRTNKGGYANWDPTKYLNIYVCNIGDGILGYASFPSSPAYLDGVVIDYTAFGTMGTVRAPFNKGRTCVHEVGHWMNLIHVWGDLDCGDDYVADTPQQKDANYGNVTTPQYSICSGKTTRDMTVNFMDYVNDDCMFMFTAGQKTRIQALFASARASILNSDGCMPTAPSTCDLGKPTIKDVKSTSVTVVWNEILGMKKYSIEYKLDGTNNWIVSQTSNLSFTINGLVSGATYQCRMKGDCAEGSYSEEVTFKTPTALQTKLSESRSFAIYPNPVVHDVNIMFDVTSDGLVNVQIFDSNGVLKTQVAKNLTKNTPAVSLDLTEFPSGFYLVVAEKDGERSVKKLLKVND